MLTKLPAFTFNPGQPEVQPISGGIRCTPPSPPSIRYKQGRAGFCVTVPGRSGQPYIPPHYVPAQDVGWNAGATSEKELDDNVQLRFLMPMVVGVVCGFTRNRADAVSRSRITHGFYFSSAGFYTVVEQGDELMRRAAYIPMQTEFKITRVNGIVTYYIDGKRLLVSRARSTGPLSVGAALFLTGDGVP